LTYAGEDPMKKLAGAALILVLVLVSLSAYLRLDHSGIGCAAWPACYGNIGLPQADVPTVDEAYQRLLEEARQPMSWATPLHRLIAGVLGLTILALTLTSLREKRNRMISLALLGLSVYLAWLGIRSTSLHDPGVVMGNLAGGFAMLGGLGWLVFRKDHSDGEKHTPLRIAAIIAIVVLGAQIFLGGLTSANFAASACQTIPDCHGGWLPGPNLGTAFDLSREHEIGPTGIALGGPERADIHKLHRLVAVLTLLFVIGAAVLAIRARSDLRIAGYVALVIVIAEFGVGVSAILTDIPIGIAVAHNWLAALLLLALLKLIAESLGIESHQS
jgi:cytochrome c oxidase assembly protein subunit 15